MAQQGIQQLADGQKLGNDGKDSLGVISLHGPVASNHKIIFPYSKSPQHAKPVIKPVADTAVNQVVATPVTEVDTVSKKEIVQEKPATYIPLMRPTDVKFEPNFTFNMFEYGDSVDYSHQLHKSQITFVSEFKEKVFTINYKKINDSSHNWMFWLLLIGLVIFGWTRLFYRKQLDLMFSSILHHNLALKSIRNASENSQRFGGILQVIFSINIALFSFQVFDFFFHTTLHGLKSTGVVFLISLGFLLLYGIKNFMYKTLGYIFLEITYVQEYLFNLHMYNRVLGIFLFPIVIAFAFIQTHIIDHRLILYVGFGMILIFFILRIIRGVQISIKSNISILYMFLYFCTLEILPIALLVKTGTIIMKMFYL